MNYFLTKDGQQIGPMSLAQLQEQIANGRNYLGGVEDESRQRIV